MLAEQGRHLAPLKAQAGIPCVNYMRRQDQRESSTAGRWEPAQFGTNLSLARVHSLQLGGCKGYPVVAPPMPVQLLAWPAWSHATQSCGQVAQLANGVEEHAPRPMPCLSGLLSKRWLRSTSAPEAPQLRLTEARESLIRCFLDAGLKCYARFAVCAMWLWVKTT